MNTLDFSTNWNNKLLCPIFHTLRLSGRFNVGDRVEVYLKSRLLGVAECVAKTHYPNFGGINPDLCYLDTGYNAQKTLGILQQMYQQVDFQTQAIYGYLFRWCQTTANYSELGNTQMKLEL